MRRHVHSVAQEFSTRLRRELQSSLFSGLAARAAGGSSKTDLLANLVCAPHPPLHVTLSWIPQPTHRSALMSLFCGDWLLGKHSANYSAKCLLPCSPQRLRLCRDAGVDPERICMWCWLNKDLTIEVDVDHVLLDWPAYSAA